MAAISMFDKVIVETKLFAVPLILIVLLGCLNTAQSQSRNSLESKRQQLIKEIELNESRLQETQKKQEVTFEQYLAIRAQVDRRRQLVSTLKKELEFTEEGIERSHVALDALSQDITRLKNEYADLIRIAYRHQLQQSYLLFLLSSKSFNEVFQRWQYIRQYDRYRKKQAELILETRERLKEKAAQLELRKQEKQDLLIVQEEQEQKLGSELANKDRLLKTLKSNESRLVKELDQQQLAHQQLNAAIETIIKTEMEQRRKAAVATSGAEVNKSLPSAAAPVTSNFAKNQGKLPWPVKNGYISRYFGKQDHPKLKGIQVTNNGIDIHTDEQALVYPVFEGTVTGMHYIPQYKNTIIVRHDNHYTVYSNLEDVYVKREDNVTPGQALGRLGKGETEFHFELWYEKGKENPLHWLAGE
ncbi:MAG TPA: peptidoglycan DD-metalloendopeptidase family protein [Saprospiraceae bacterium]|nr:peptidoglycan DD-metalloendopeptidase family protein [Saprospiraceae bacterium]